MKQNRNQINFNLDIISNKTVAIQKKLNQLNMFYNLYIFLCKFRFKGITQNIRGNLQEENAGPLHAIEILLHFFCILIVLRERRKIGNLFEKK